MGRTFLVGDVHGCHEELAALIEAVHLGPSDQLVLCGDLVARGPDSGAVVRIAREHRALRVLGNHETHLLAFRRSEKTKLGAAHQKAYDELSPADWEYLETAPFTLDLPAHGIRVVHAGMDPHLPWDRQDPDVLVTIRTAKGDAKTTEGKDEAVPWGTLYQGPPHAVFGHDARAGLQIHAWCTGLDTGCVYGGMLTGMLLEAGQQVPTDVAERTALLHSVPAKQRYYAVK